MKQQLRQLQQEGLLAEVSVVDISRDPALAQELGIRSVPWLELGDFVLIGAHSREEIAHWLAEAGREDGLAHYFDDLLTTGQATLVEQRLRQHPQQMTAILQLLADPATSINARVGVGAVFEGLARDGLLAPWVDQLGALCRQDNATVRADACHFLGLTGDTAAAPYLQACLSDNDAQVREIAEESLQLLPGV
jgi:hypothetical protein